MTMSASYLSSLSFKCFFLIILQGSPSPLVGMSYGVAFLNPLREANGVWPQHKAMSRIGFPYSYVVDLENITSVVQAAELSYKYRFSSYVPPSYRIKSLVDRMRRLLEDDSFCTCSKKLLPKEYNMMLENDTKKEDNEEKGATT